MAQMLEAHVQEEADVGIVEGVEDVTATSAVAHDPARAQEAEVMRAGGLAQPGDGGKIADAQLATLQESDDQADPPRVGQDLERLSQFL